MQNTLEMLQKKSLSEMKFLKESALKEIATIKELSSLTSEI
jgi:hypothetical protein